MIAAVSGVPPVQLREVEKDVDAAHEEIHARDDVDPVADADVVRVCGGHRGAFYAQL